MIQITKEHLAFVEEARRAFESDDSLYTYRNGTNDLNDTLIALRYGMDRDCILVYELNGYVANFVQQTNPAPIPRREVVKFSFYMEKHLEMNEHKGGWNNESWESLLERLRSNAFILKRALVHHPDDRAKITEQCADIANFAMMIADKYGEKS